MFFDDKAVREWDDYLGYIYTCECIEKKRARKVYEYEEEEEDEEPLCFDVYEEEEPQEEFDVWTGKY